jgi:hypothetical protein
MTGLIEPDLQGAYDWSFSQTDTSVTVSFTFPATFNLSCVRADLNASKSAISVVVPNSPPLLHGRLVEPVAGVICASDNPTHTVRVTLAKSLPEPWPLVVSTGHPNAQTIDAKSAFLIWSALMASQQAELVPTAMDYLRLSADVGFVPALTTFARLCLGHKTAHAHGIEMLNIAANRYHDVASTAQLAYFLVLDGNRDGFAILEQAAEAGSPDAHFFLGKLLSPVCTEQWSPKNGPQAMKHLQMSTDIRGNYLASCEIARLLWAGCDGIPQDRQRAKALYSQAQELAHGAELPPLEGESRVTTWLVPGAALAAVAAFGLALFFHLRRRK